MHAASSGRLRFAFESGYLVGLKVQVGAKIQLHSIEILAKNANHEN